MKRRPPAIVPVLPDDCFFYDGSPVKSVIVEEKEVLLGLPVQFFDVASGRVEEELLHLTADLRLVKRVARQLFGCAAALTLHTVEVEGEAGERSAPVDSSLATRKSLVERGREQDSAGAWESSWREWQGALLERRAAAVGVRVLRCVRLLDDSAALEDCRAGLEDLERLASVALNTAEFKATVIEALANLLVAPAEPEEGPAPEDEDLGIRAARVIWRLASQPDTEGSLDALLWKHDIPRLLSAKAGESTHASALCVLLERSSVSDDFDTLGALLKCDAKLAAPAIARWLVFGDSDLRRSVVADGRLLLPLEHDAAVEATAACLREPAARDVWDPRDTVRLLEPLTKKCQDLLKLLCDSDLRKQRLHEVKAALSHAAVALWATAEIIGSSRDHLALGCETSLVTCCLDLVKSPASEAALGVLAQLAAFSIWNKNDSEGALRVIVTHLEDDRCHAEVGAAALLGLTRHASRLVVSCDVTSRILGLVQRMPSVASVVLCLALKVPEAFGEAELQELLRQMPFNSNATYQAALWALLRRGHCEHHHEAAAAVLMQGKDEAIVLASVGFLARTSKGALALFQAGALSKLGLCVTRRTAPLTEKADHRLEHLAMDAAHACLLHNRQVDAAELATSERFVEVILEWGDREAAELEWPIRCCAVLLGVAVCHSSDAARRSFGKPGILETMLSKLLVFSKGKKKKKKRRHAEEDPHLRALIRAVLVLSATSVQSCKRLGSDRPLVRALVRAAQSKEQKSEDAIATLANLASGEQSNICAVALPFLLRTAKQHGHQKSQLIAQSALHRLAASAPCRAALFKHQLHEASQTLTQSLSLPALNTASYSSCSTSSTHVPDDVRTMLRGNAKLLWEDEEESRQLPAVTKVDNNNPWEPRVQRFLQTVTTEEEGAGLKLLTRSEANPTKKPTTRLGEPGRLAESLKAESLAAQEQRQQQRLGGGGGEKEVDADRASSWVSIARPDDGDGKWFHFAADGRSTKGKGGQRLAKWSHVEGSRVSEGLFFEPQNDHYFYYDPGHEQAPKIFASELAGLPPPSSSESEDEMMMTMLKKQLPVKRSPTLAEAPFLVPRSAPRPLKLPPSDDDEDGRLLIKPEPLVVCVESSELPTTFEMEHSSFAGRLATSGGFLDQLESSHAALKHDWQLMKNPLFHASSEETDAEILARVVNMTDYRGIVYTFEEMQGSREVAFEAWCKERKVLSTKAVANKLQPAQLEAVFKSIQAAAAPEEEEEEEGPADPSSRVPEEPAEREEDGEWRSWLLEAVLRSGLALYATHKPGEAVRRFLGQLRIKSSRCAARDDFRSNLLYSTPVDLVLGAHYRELRWLFQEHDGLMGLKEWLEVVGDVLSEDVYLGLDDAALETAFTRSKLLTGDRRRLSLCDFFEALCRLAHATRISATVDIRTVDVLEAAKAAAVAAATPPPEEPPCAVAVPAVRGVPPLKQFLPANGEESDSLNSGSHLSSPTPRISSPTPRGPRPTPRESVMSARSSVSQPTPRGGEASSFGTARHTTSDPEQSEQKRRDRAQKLADKLHFILRLLFARMAIRAGQGTLVSSKMRRNNNGLLKLVPKYLTADQLADALRPPEPEPEPPATTPIIEPEPESPKRRRKKNQPQSRSSSSSSSTAASP